MSTLPNEVSNFFLAMQAGSVGIETMRRLFAEEAVYEEPFSGETKTHRGRPAILAVMETGAKTPLPDVHIVIDRAEATGSTIEVDWSCFSPALPGGKGQGRNHFELRDGQILRLITTLKD